MAPMPLVGTPQHTSWFLGVLCLLEELLNIGTLLHGSYPMLVVGTRTHSSLLLCFLWELSNMFHRSYASCRNS